MNDRNPDAAPRIALYSHDTMGLGHIRRNQLIASVLAGPPIHATVLLITGVRQGGAFEMPGAIDTVVLPAYRKGADAGYTSRSLAIGVNELAGMRADLIDRTLQHFRPDLFIADNVPSGALGELKPALARMRLPGSRTFCVLGLRDILDDPETVRSEWNRRGDFQTVRDMYDAVWIYGDEQAFPTMQAYAFPHDIRRKAIHTGYLDPFHPSSPRGRGKVTWPTQMRTVICAVGGGQDGYELARNFIGATMPPQMHGLIMTGPLMPPDQQAALGRMIAGRTDVEIVNGVHDLVPMLAGAERVVAMAGYNTVNEVLGSGVPVLLVPRTSPRKEQLIRAQRLQELGLASFISHETITPADISAWLARPAARQDARARIDFDGLDTIVSESLAVIHPRFANARRGAPALESRVA